MTIDTKDHEGERRGLTRRQIIQGAAVGGAAFWSVPVIDSVTSVAAAGSGCPHYLMYQLTATNGQLAFGNPDNGGSSAHCKPPGWFGGTFMGSPVTAISCAGTAQGNKVQCGNVEAAGKFDTSVTFTILSPSTCVFVGGSSECTGPNNSTQCAPGTLGTDNKGQSTLTFDAAACTATGGTGLYVIRIMVCSQSATGC